jgi:hypothetical protein
MAALTSKAIELAVGTNSCSNFSCFGPSSMFVMVQPVRFALWLVETGDKTSLNWVPPQSRRLMPSMASSRADLIVLNHGEACRPSLCSSRNYHHGGLANSLLHCGISAR